MAGTMAGKIRGVSGRETCHSGDDASAVRGKKPFAEAFLLLIEQAGSPSFLNLQ
ncbi:hypothetical protein ABMB67_000219 [Halalkalibacter oceani]